jgi:hypothetical protein
VLFPRKTGAAVFAHTGAASQAEGAERGGPEGICLWSKPALDISRGFGSVLGGVLPLDGRLLVYTACVCPPRNSALRSNPPPGFSESRLRMMADFGASPRHAVIVRRRFGQHEQKL